MVKWYCGTVMTGPYKRLPPFLRMRFQTRSCYVNTSNFVQTVNFSIQSAKHCFSLLTSKWKFVRMIFVKGVVAACGRGTSTF